jgi:hypothetical protein
VTPPRLEPGAIAALNVLRQSLLAWRSRLREAAQRCPDSSASVDLSDAADRLECAADDVGAAAYKSLSHEGVHDSEDNAAV